jgi:hypothetical protein
VIKIELKSRPDIARLIGTLSRKRTAYLHYCSEVAMSNTYWDGGSCNVYYTVDRSSGQSQLLPRVPPPQFGGPDADPVVQLQSNQAVVRVGVFCGKPSTPVVYLLPESA